MSLFMAAPLCAAEPPVPPAGAGTAHLALPNYDEVRSLVARDPEVGPVFRRDRQLWLASLLAVAGAAAFDTASSWNKTELNPVLRNSQGTFSHQGAMVKLGITGSFLLFEALAGRRHPDLYKPLAITNYAVAGSYSAIATRNMRLR